MQVTANPFGYSAPPLGPIEGVINFHAVGELRSLIEKMKFDGYDVHLWISSGWLSKPFAIRGSEEAMRRVTRTLQAWRQIDRNGG